MKTSLAMVATLLFSTLLPAQGMMPRGSATPQFSQMTMMVFDKQLKQDGVTQMIPTQTAQTLLTHRVDPVLPKTDKKADKSAALNAYIQGTTLTPTVVLAFEIDKKGKVRRATVVSGPQQLQAAALDAVKQWSFKPFIDRGEPIAVGTSFPLTFRPR